jgi:hypothetical protein
MREVNQEQPMHALYDYAYITDAKEGLILTDVNTLSDGEPRNNYLQRALTWNADGILNGARHMVMGGIYAYIVADAGLVVVNLDEPLAPKLEAVVALNNGHSVALQFRYLFVTDADGSIVRWLGECPGPATTRGGGGFTRGRCQLRQQCLPRQGEQRSRVHGVAQ